MKIKFSHHYPKLHGQDSAVLLQTTLVDSCNMSLEFVEYDTSYVGKDGVEHYQLQKNRYILLVFVGNKMIPFTTVRRYTPGKYRYYNSNIGEVFDIKIEEDTND
jgi:hypothetical protein